MFANGISRFYQYSPKAVHVQKYATKSGTFFAVRLEFAGFAFFVEVFYAFHWSLGPVIKLCEDAFVDGLYELVDRLSLECEFEMAVELADDERMMDEIHS